VVFKYIGIKLVIPIVAMHDIPGAQPQKKFFINRLITPLQKKIDARSLFLIELLLLVMEYIAFLLEKYPHYC